MSWNLNQGVMDEPREIIDCNGERRFRMIRMIGANPKNDNGLNLDKYIAYKSGMMRGNDVIMTDSKSASRWIRDKTIAKRSRDSADWTRDRGIPKTVSMDGARPDKIMSKDIGTDKNC